MVKDIGPGIGMLDVGQYEFNMMMMVIKDAINYIANIDFMKTLKWDLLLSLVIMSRYVHAIHINTGEWLVFKF